MLRNSLTSQPLKQLSQIKKSSAERTEFEWVGTTDLAVEGTLFGQ